MYGVGACMHVCMSVCRLHACTLVTGTCTLACIYADMLPHTHCVCIKCLYVMRVLHVCVNGCVKRMWAVICCV